MPNRLRIALLLAAAAGACAAWPAAAAGQSEGLARTGGGPRVSTVVRGLDTPWEIAFLPDRTALITERRGTVRLLARGARLRTVARLPVMALGEGGLLGLAADPDFARNRFVYIYRTTQGGNQVVRYRFAGGRLGGGRTLVGRIPRAPNHNGGRIHFGPDGRLYFSTGDAQEPGLAQNGRSLAGKVLRMTPGQYRGRGGRPETFTLGHRNPQGFDWQPGSGRLIATEHGPDGDDEVNFLRRGGNYGWPLLRGTRRRAGFNSPLVVYPTSIAPSGATFVSLPGSAWTGDLLIGALRGAQVRRLRFDGRLRATRNQALFLGDFGRLRTVVEGPDGALYALTSNRDGRGSPRAGDDRLLRIVPPAG